MLAAYRLRERVMTIFSYMSLPMITPEMTVVSLVFGILLLAAVIRYMLADLI